MDIRSDIHKLTERMNDIEQQLYTQITKMNDLEEFIHRQMKYILKIEQETEYYKYLSAGRSLPPIFEEKEEPEIKSDLLIKRKEPKPKLPMFWSMNPRPRK